MIASKSKQINVRMLSQVRRPFRFGNPPKGASPLDDIYDNRQHFYHTRNPRRKEIRADKTNKMVTFIQFLLHECDDRRKNRCSLDEK